MPLAELRVENLRCIESAALEFSPELNLIAGENGAGKTSILLNCANTATLRVGGLRH